MNFGPLILTHLESHLPELQDPKNLWTKVQKRRRYGDEGEKRKTSTISKLMTFGPHILTLLERPRAVLQNPQKIVGQSSKTDEIWPWGAKNGKPHFLETDELWST